MHFHFCCVIRCCSLAKPSKHNRASVKWRHTTGKHAGLPSCMRQVAYVFAEPPVVWAWLVKTATSDHIETSQCSPLHLHRPTLLSTHTALHAWKLDSDTISYNGTWPAAFVLACPPVLHMPQLPRSGAAMVLVHLLSRFTRDTAVQQGQSLLWFKFQLASDVAVQVLLCRP